MVTCLKLSWPSWRFGRRQKICKNNRVEGFFGYLNDYNMNWPMSMSEGTEWLLKMHSLILLNNREKDVTHEMIEEKIRELKPKHSDFAAVLEVIHQMDLKQTVKAFIVVESLRQVLKIHASRLASLWRKIKELEDVVSLASPIFHYPLIFLLHDDDRNLVYLFFAGEIKIILVHMNRASWICEPHLRYEWMVT